MFDILKKNWSRWTEVQRNAFIGDVMQTGGAVFFLVNTLRLLHKGNNGAAVVNAIMLHNINRTSEWRVNRRDRLNPSANYINNSKVV